MPGLSKTAFRLLARVNKAVLPRYRKKDLNKLSKLDQAIIAYRYYITKNSLPD